MMVKLNVNWLDMDLVCGGACGLMYSGAVKSKMRLPPAPGLDVAVFTVFWRMAASMAENTRPPKSRGVKLVVSAACIMWAIRVT